VNIHPKKNDTIPRFYSKLAILFFEKGFFFYCQIFFEKKIYIAFERNIAPKKTLCMIPIQASLVC
jgi:hypothetical protein